MASFLMSSLHATEVADEKDISASNSSMPASIIADAIANSYHPPEASPKAAEATLPSDPLPVVSLDDTVPEAATEAASSDTVVSEGSSSASEEEVSNEPTWFDKAWSFLKWDEISYKQKAATVRKRYKLRMKYGESADKDPNYSILVQMEKDVDEADEVRRQKQLALEVKEAESLKLYNESLECLALNGYHESRSETADQELASAAVVLNRLSVGFRGATTICEVIYTPKQFSWVEQHGVHTPDTSNKIEKAAWERSLLLARRMLDADATYIDPSNGALYYYNPSIVDWKYKDAYVQVAVLGSHRFMTEGNPSHPEYIDNTSVRINPVLFNGLTHKERDQLIKQYQTK
jgi:spore germination cell wall hydrolase CwlJ-like protein